MDDADSAVLMAKLAESAEALGARAVVTAASPVAASIALGILERGGNVYDAVVSAALAETVILPPKCGLAGDLVALSVEAGRTAPTALVSIGGAARGLARAVRERQLPTTGALSVGIPGAPAGYAELAAKGRLSLEELAAPAVSLARDGFPWSPVAEQLTRAARELLLRENPGGVVYLPDGEPVMAGTIVTAPGLADALEEFVERGASIFSGAIGDAVADAIRSRGGIIERDELTAAIPEWSEPTAANIAGTTVWTTPEPTHGPSLVAAVAAIPRDARPADVVRSVEQVVTERGAHLADLRDSGTSVVGAADRDGNAVVMVHSNSFQQYGSGIVVEPYGLVLCNRAGRGFSSRDGHPNYPAHGKRPATTLHAWAVSDGRGPRLLGATPGGENQMRWNAQTVAAVLDGQLRPGELVSAPRWGRFGDKLVVERGFTGDDIDALGRTGTSMEVVDPLTLRSAQQVLRLSRDGEAVVAGADPRTGATALAR